MTPRREILEEHIKWMISQGYRGDENIGAIMELSGSYIKSIRCAAGIKFPAKPKTVRKKRAKEYLQAPANETGRKIEASFSVHEDNKSWI